MRVSTDRRKNLIAGLLPAGSGNDFARTLKLQKGISHLHNLIVNRSSDIIDIGKLEFKNIEGEDAVYYFINIADVGLGAEIAKRVNEGNKKYGPNIAFFAATIKSFLRYKNKKIKII